MVNVFLSLLCCCQVNIFLNIANISNTRGWNLFLAWKLKKYIYTPVSHDTLEVRTDLGIATAGRHSTVILM